MIKENAIVVRWGIVMI